MTKKAMMLPIADLAALLLSLYFAVRWIFDPSGHYEPIIVFIGILYGIGRYYKSYSVELFKREGKLFTPDELIRHSEKLRKPLQDEIHKCRAEKLNPDVVIRHVNRHDKYPHNVDDNEKGISPWFRVALLDMYHNGIKVGLNYIDLKNSSKGYRVLDKSNGEERDVRAVLIAEIPFSAIVEVNMEGDEYYSYPHIFCYFPFNGEPYERLFFCEKIDTGHGHLYFKELAEFDEVKTIV